MVDTAHYAFVKTHRTAQQSDPECKLKFGSWQCIKIDSSAVVNIPHESKILQIGRLCGREVV